MQKNTAKMSIGLGVSIRDKNSKYIKDIYDPIIYKGAKLPSTRNRIYKTTRTNQTAINLRIYGGENTFTKDNLELGEFFIDKIPKNDIGKEKVYINFLLDEDLILHINIRIKSTGTKYTKFIDTKLIQEDIRIFNRLYNK